MVSLVLCDISLQERQECVGIGRSGSDVAGVSSGVETGSVASYWASSDARSAARRAGVRGGARAEISLWNRRGH